MSQHGIWLCSHNMKSAATHSETEMGHYTKDFTFKLCQEVGLPKHAASIGNATWLPVTTNFPNRWLTYGNARHSVDPWHLVHSMALGINLNSGYLPKKYTVIPIDGVEEKCILVVHGKFHGSNSDFTVATMHGDWDPKFGYKNPNNERAVTFFIEYMRVYLRQFGGHFVLAGDFNIDHSALCELKAKLDRILPGLKYPTLESKITTFVDKEYVSIDHIISNIDVTRVTTLIDVRKSDHLMLAFKIYLPYAVKPWTIVDLEPTYVSCSDPCGCDETSDDYGQRSTL